MIVTPQRGGTAWLALAGLLVTGCLGPVYQVPNTELERLARLPQERRGENVRVVQQFSTHERPRASAPSGGGGVHVGVVAVVGAGGHHHHHGHGRGRRNPRRNPRPVADEQAAGAALMVLAAGAAVGLAVTEGSRWDGWVRVHPEHPVYLTDREGRTLAVPLAALTPEHASWAEEAVIVEDEGPTFERTERAPLDRTGFTYGVDLGAAGIATRTDEAPIGFGGRLLFGGFPWNELGILGAIGLGWADDAAGRALFNTRIALELHLYPFSLGLARPGLFVQAGDLFHDQDTARGPDTGHRFLAGGGGLLQIEVTTRFAFTLRGGVAAVGSEAGTVVLPEVSLGGSIY